MRSDRPFRTGWPPVSGRSALLSLLSPIAVLAACGPSDAHRDAIRSKTAGGTIADTVDGFATGISTSEARFAGNITGFREPESVRYDPDQDVFFVSNMFGLGSLKDGNGFISKVSAANPEDARPLVQGGKNGAVLDAPKGMALHGDTLWVADIDKVRAFSKTTGQPLFTVDFTALNATFLNDVAVAPDGNIYITDTSILFNPDGSTSHPAVDKIFVIRNVSRRMGTVADQGDRFGRPNGIAWDATHSRFLVVSFGAPTVLSWTPGALKPPTTVATGAGQFDGVVALPDGRALVSSWADSSLFVLDGDSLTRVVAGGLPTPADLHVDRRTNTIAIPLSSQNEVVFYTMPRAR